MDQGGPGIMARGNGLYKRLNEKGQERQVKPPNEQAVGDTNLGQKKIR